jgi:integrase
VRHATEQYVEGARSGTIRNRSGEKYKPSAVRGIEQAFRLRLTPAFGPRRLGDVRRADLQRLIDRMQAHGLAASTIRNTVNAVRALYRHAVRLDLVTVDPTDGLALPAVRGQRDRIASPQEAEALLAVLPIGDRAVWGAAFYAGLRLGELQALRWEAIDLAAGIIRVEQSWDARVGPVAPKSRAGTRKVPVAPGLRDLLVEHRMSQGRDRGLAFGRTCERPFNPPTIAMRAKQAWLAAELEPITLHECRHTFASFMIAAGVNAKALSTFMGHSSITITYDRYGHMLPGAEDEAADLLHAYLSRSTDGRGLVEVA